MPEIKLVDYLTDLKQNLYAFNVNSPDSEAELILSEVLSVPKLELYLQSERLLTQTEKDQLSEILNRRKTGEPLQYIIGKAWFGDLCLEVGEGVLIPRPETELLVEFVCENAPLNAEICELGTGSGAISISIAYERSDLKISASDISEKALQYANKNLNKYQLDNVEFFEGHLFSPFKKHKSFDLICANLPYVSEAEYSDLPEEVKNFEPENALLSGTYGLDLIAETIETAPDFLKKNGLIILEHGETQGEKIKELFHKSKLYNNIGTIKDLTGRDRFTSAGII